MMLNELQKDVLTEFFNICVGQAAALLAEIVNRKIKLSIPNIDLLPADQITPNYFDEHIDSSSGHVMSSSLQFGQEYSGKIFLLFPVEQAKILVSLCLNEYSDDNQNTHDKQDLLDTDFDVIKEIGNIILNSVVGGLGNLLATKLVYSLPEVELLFVSSEKQADLLQNTVYAFLLKTVFSIEQTQFSGAILIVLGIDSVSRLIAKIDNLLEESNESAF